MLRPREDARYGAAATGLNIKEDWRSATPVEENSTGSHGRPRTGTDKRLVFVRVLSVNVRVGPCRYAASP